MPVRFREEIQEVLRRGDGELSCRFDWTSEAVRSRTLSQMLGT